MPDHRNHQTVAQRLELQLERCPNPLLRLRRWLTLASGMVPLVVIGWFAVRGDHTIFLSRPVAVSHQHFQDDCQTCHRTPWQPLVRLATADSGARSVHDDDCQQCHTQHKADHNILAMAQGVPDCVACHQEHRGPVRLTHGADTMCVTCHQPFEQHPQFALLRAWSTDQEPTASTAARISELEKLAVLVPNSDSTGSAHGAWVDKTALKFSHEGHLGPLVTSLQRDEAGEATSQPPTQLTCADCHELDLDGRSMRAIAYERHCRDCHPLRFSSKLNVAGVANANDPAHQLPHEAPEIVRSVMRERLTANARLHLADATSPNSTSPPRLPNRQAPQAQLEWNWVAQELLALENAIFGLPSKDTSSPSGNACLKCHEPGAGPTAVGATAVGATAVGPTQAQSAGGETSNFTIKSPEIPSRWLTHSHFRHDRHLNTSCVECHHAAGVTNSDRSDVPLAARMGSKQVQDILLPSVESCQTCHGASHGSREDFRPARKNCTECHQYHHANFSQADDGSLPR